MLEEESKFILIKKIQKASRYLLSGSLLSLFLALFGAGFAADTAAAAGGRGTGGGL